MYHHDDPLATAPHDVLAFFATAEELRTPALAINPLSVDRAREYTAAIRKLEIGVELGLIALDDANDSNPYCYISKGPAAGMVLHLHHDDSPSIKFPNLESFADALTSAKRSGTHIDNIAGRWISPLPDQTSLLQALEAWSHPQYEGGELLIEVLLPLLSPDHVQLIGRLGSSANFFIRESVAHFIRVHPLRDFENLAKTLAGDRYKQVSTPARAALSAIRRVAAGGA